MTESTESDLTAERDRLTAEIARLRVSRDTGVPVDLLSGTTTEEAARAMAEGLLAWKAATAPSRPATAAVPAYPVSQFSRESLAYLDADQITALWREGRLEGIGAPAPGSMNSGERHG